MQRTWNEAWFYLNSLSMISVNVHTNNRFTELGICRLNNVIVQMFLDTEHNTNIKRSKL